MKNAIKLLTLIALLSMTCAVKAQDAPTTKPTALKGRVTSVDGMIITIKGKKGVESTITTDTTTTFMLDGQPATLADIKAGQRVISVTQPDGGSVASEVKLASGGKKKKKKSDEAPTTAPAPN